MNKLEEDFQKQIDIMKDKNLKDLDSIEES